MWSYAVQIRRQPLIETMQANSMMPGVIVIPPGEPENVPLTQEVTGDSRQTLHQQEEKHIDGGLSVVDEASVSQQSGALSAGGLDVSSSSIGSAMSSESSWVTESEDETDSGSDSESEEGSSNLQDSATEVGRSTVTLDQETSRTKLEESASSIDHVSQSQVSVTAGTKSVKEETKPDVEPDDLATISQAWSVQTDTLPVTHKSVANYGALLTSRESRAGRHPQFMTLKDAADSESSYQPLPEPHVRSPPRPQRRPPTIHTQYEFIEGCGINDPLSWHRLGLAVESSFIPSRK